MRRLVICASLLIGLCSLSAPAEAYQGIQLEKAAFCYQPTGAQAQSAPCLDLPRWDVAGGLAPKTFSVRVTVKAYGNQVSSNVPVRIDYAIKVGELTLDPETLLVDTAYLKSSAQWRLWGSRMETLPLLAPQETMDYVTAPVPFQHLIGQLQDRYPVAIRATVTLPKIKAKKVIELPVISRPFAAQFLPAPD